MMILWALTVAFAEAQSATLVPQKAKLQNELS
jgi:hypothetical protein